MSSSEDGGAVLAAFRCEVRAFFTSDYPQDILAKAAAGSLMTRDDHRRSQEALQSRGWLAGWWPSEHGGQGWSFAQRHVFDEEAGRAGMPAPWRKRRPGGRRTGWPCLPGPRAWAAARPRAC